MQATAPSPQRKARIEIIPLIDIMFFLLASFMLVSLTMTRLQGLHVSLPSITASHPTVSTGEILKLEVSATTDGRNASIFTLARQPITAEALVVALKQRMAADQAEAKETKLFIAVDRNARHANLIQALDKVKEAGLQKFGFSLPRGGAASSSPTRAVPQCP